jgi:hypothetical protein
VIVALNLPYFLTLSPFFCGIELTMCSRNAHINRSFKLACFEEEKDGKSKVYEIRLPQGWLRGLLLIIGQPEVLISQLGG